MSRPDTYAVKGSMRAKVGRKGFEFRFYVPTPDGGKRRMSVYAGTKRECLDKARQALARLEAELPARDSRESLNALVATWEKTWLRTQGRRPSTTDLYSTLVRKHVVPTLGHLPISRVRPSHVRELLASLDLAASSKRSLYAALSDVFECAVTDGLLATNPVRSVKRPSRDYRVARELTAKNVTDVLAATTGHKWRPALLIAATTGARRGEVLALHWDDIDLDAGVIHIRRNLTRTSEGLTMGDPKSKHGVRTVPLLPAVARELRAFQIEQAKMRLRMGEVWTHHGLVTTTDMGGPVEPRNFSRWYEKHAKNAGLQDTGIHALRHYFATVAISTGGSPVDVAKVLGHSSPTITLDLYANAVAEGQRRSAANVGASLGIS